MTREVPRPRSSPTSLKQWESFEVTLDLPAGTGSAPDGTTGTPTPLGRTLYVPARFGHRPKDTRTRFMKRVASISPEAGEEQQTGDLVLWYSHPGASGAPHARGGRPLHPRLCRGSQTPARRFEGGVAGADPRVWSHPKFLFRRELDDRPKSATHKPLDEFQLASRLSYFLWSTMPDEELLHLASRASWAASWMHRCVACCRDPKSAAPWFKTSACSGYNSAARHLPAGFEAPPSTRPLQVNASPSELSWGNRARRPKLLDLVDADHVTSTGPCPSSYGLERKAPGSEPQAVAGAIGRRNGNTSGSSLPTGSAAITDPGKHPDSDV